jgi:hypothetical protein
MKIIHLKNRRENGNVMDESVKVSMDNHET